MAYIFLLLLLIACNGFFVASEISLVRVRKTRMDILARRKNKQALLVQKLLQNPSKFFSATQLGITLSSLALGSIGEPVVANAISNMLIFLPHSLGIISSHAIAIMLAFAFITFLQIIFGELIPKTIAIQKAERIVFMNSRLLSIFVFLFQPAIMLLSTISNTIVRLLGIIPSGKSSVSKEEIKLILSQSAESGALNRREIALIKKVFHISEIPVTTIMTANSTIVAINELSTVEEALTKVDGKYVHSRFPVYQYSINNIVGFIHVIDLHRAILQGNGSKAIASLGILRNTILIDYRARVDDVIILMKRKTTHLAVIKDQKQKTIGIVTIEDVVRQFAEV